MAAFKPNKPKEFDGKRDELAVRGWIYQMQQYINLVQISSRATMDESTKVSLASSYLSGTAASWWYTKIAANSVPTTWRDFESAVVKEFIPRDSVQRARDKLRRLVQKTSVSTYLSEFRNVILAIPGMTEGEQVDRFVQGLKNQVKLEVLKSGTQSMEEASTIALSVDSALFGARMYQNPRWSPSPGFPAPVSTPMDIGNLEQRNKDRKTMRVISAIR